MQFGCPQEKEIGVRCLSMHKYVRSRTQTIHHAIPIPDEGVLAGQIGLKKGAKETETKEGNEEVERGRKDWEIG